jgi:protoheme IX farnesyltransferase
VNRLYAWGILLKPKVLVAMVALYVTTYLSSYLMNVENAPGFYLFLQGLAAVVVAVSGANALNCYLDRDIDSIMVRTQGRLVAMVTAGEVPARDMSVLLLAVASTLSLLLGLVPFSLFVVGTGFYLLVYTALLKRRTAWNVLATLPSIASPAFLGWYLGGAPLIPVGFLVIFLIAVWGPLHLWSLAYAYSKDYSRVDVPMMTALMPKDVASKTILLMVMLQVASSYLLATWTTKFYLVGISIFNVVLLGLGLVFIRDPTSRLAYRIFKLSAPYIVVLLLLFMLDQLLV